MNPILELNIDYYSLIGDDTRAVVAAIECTASAQMLPVDLRSTQTGGRQGKGRWPGGGLGRS